MAVSQRSASRGHRCRLGRQALLLLLSKAGVQELGSPWPSPPPDCPWAPCPRPGYGLSPKAEGPPSGP